ncbi:TolC family protein [Albibacterium indicum]|uniref:TolC family protein n=1 Tax=Albibacterium indicum TaxID=2292082 RepID=UPI000E520787|nr:TolC family protein [Pedobacter indicus]
MKKLVYILIFGLFCNSAIAQKTEILSLSESIGLAADSSLQSFRAKNLYQAGYWEYHAYKAGRLPTLSLTMTPIQYTRDFTRRYDSENNIDVYRRQQSLFSYGNLSLAQNIDVTGGTVFVDSELGYMRNFGASTYTQFTSVPIRVGYSQALFGFNSFKWEKKIEPLKYEEAKKQYLFDREEISETVIEYFFNLALAQAEYDLAKDNVLSTDTLYNIGKQRQQIASISQADLLTLRLDAINAQNTLKNAEVELKKAKYSFVSYLNLDKETDVVLELPEVPRKLDISLEKALEYAKNNNPNYLANQQQVLEAEREVDQTKKSTLFDASLSASVGFNQIANNFADAYYQPLRQDLVSISLTVPLVDWGVRKGKANMARNNLGVAQITFQQEELSLDQEVRITLNDFEIQLDMIASAQEASDLANMAYEATKARFIIGKADINSLTLAQNRQKEAQSNYISTLRYYWQNYYKLRKLTLYDFEKQEPLTYQFDVMH